MARVDNEGGRPSLLEVNRGRAIQLLEARLETSAMRGLRKHQAPVIRDWLSHLKQGETAGYMLLPTGAGKTHVAAKIVELGLPTIITSPTGVILDKTKATLEAHAEGINSVTPSLDDDIAAVLATLSEREQRVIEARFGLRDRDNGKTLDEIGNEIGVWRETIRQNEVHALSKLRHHSRAGRLLRHLPTEE